jgi:hypothetical protein
MRVKSAHFAMYFCAFYTLYLSVFKSIEDRHLVTDIARRVQLDNLTRWYVASPEWRFLLEGLAWFALVSVIWSFDLMTKFEERWRIGAGLDDFRLVAEQITSAIAVMVMLLALRFWTRWFVFRFDNALRLIVGVVAGSWLFAFGHYNLIIAQRALVYPVFGETYIFSNYLWNLWFEWQKDVKIVLIAWGIMWLYRRWFYQLSQKVVERPEKIHAQTGTGDIYVSPDDIYAVEASKNYVSLILSDRECIVRCTLAQMETQLSGYGVIQIHRSYLVRVNSIAKVSRQKGNTHVILSNGRAFPVSRTFKPALKNAMGNIINN